MDASDTARLTERIIATWPTGPRGHIWTEALTKLDNPNRARQTYDQLVTTDERPPSVARFLDAYHTLDRQRLGIPRPEHTGPPASLNTLLESPTFDPEARRNLEQLRNRPALPARSRRR